VRVRPPGAVAVGLICSILLALACSLGYAQYESLPGQLDVDSGGAAGIGEGLPGPASTGEAPRGGRRGPGGMDTTGIFATDDKDAFGGLPFDDGERRRGAGTTYQPVPTSLGGDTGNGYDTGGQEQYGYASGSGEGYYAQQSHSGGRRRYADDEKLDINGRASLAYRYHSVTGAVEQFENQWADTQPWERNLSLSWRGQVFGPLYSTGNLRMGPYVPTIADWSVSGHTNNFDVTYGDLDVSIGRSPFARLQKSIAGWEAYGQYGRMQASFFTAGQKSRVRRETMQGEGTNGPYRLQFAPIREGTEHVRVDDRDFSQRQYDLNYETGLLTFNEGITIPPSSVIQVVYEENNPSLTQGRFWGAEFVASVGKTPIGVTYLSQVVPGSSGSSTTSKLFEETFYGNNSTGPFFLGRKPIDFDQTIEVFVDGIQRFSGQDWEINPSSGAIQFYNIVPATATVIIRYYYFDIDQTPTYSRSVLGIDTGLNLDDGAVAVSYARSDAGPERGQGNALKVRGVYDLLDGRLHVDGGYNYMDPTFTRLESASFERDRTGFDFSADYEPRDDLRLWADYSRDRSNQGYITGASLGGFTGASSTGKAFDVATTRYSAGADFSHKGLPTVHFDLSRLNSGRASTGGSQTGSESLAVSHSIGKLSLGFAADQTRRTFAPSSSGSSTDQSGTGGTTDQTSAYASQPEDSLSRQYRLNGRFSFRESDSISGAYSVNTTKDRYDSTRDSEGHTLNGQVEIVPVKQLRLSASHRATLSKGAVFIGGTTGGYYGNYGVPTSGGFDYGGGWGTGGSGGSGGSGGWDFGGSSGSGRSASADSVFRSTAAQAALATYLPYTMRQSSTSDTSSSYSQALTNDSTTGINIDFQPMDKLQIGYSIDRRLYETEGQVGFLADNESWSRTLTCNFRPFERLSLSGGYSWSNTRYLDQVYGKVSTEMLNLSGQLEITKNLGLNLGYYLTSAINPAYSGSTGQSSGGGVTIITGNSYSTLRGDISYRISKNTDFYIRGEQTFNRGGFDDSDRRMVWLGMDQDLTKDITLNLALRYINYQSRPTLFGLPEARNYNALSFQAQLTAQF